MFMMQSSTSPDRSKHVRKACDLCYLRKVRCDRHDPCGNCQDANIVCRRTRQSKGRENRLNSPLRDATNASASKLPSIPPSVDARSYASSGESCGPFLLEATDQTSKEDQSHRNEPMAFFEDNVNFPVASMMSTMYDTQYDRLPITDGRNIISYELQQIRDPFCDKERILRTALHVVDQLTARQEPIGELAGSAQQDQSPWATKIPSVEFLDCMLRDIGSDRFGSHVSDFFKHVSNATLRQMALHLYSNVPGEHADMCTICVNATVYKFLTTVTILEENEFRTKLIRSALEYKEAAKRALRRIPLLSPPSLYLLQALLCGVFLHQGSGETTLCWELTKAACRVCRDLGIHSALLNGTETSEEAYFCFFWCYILDKTFTCRFGSSSFQILLGDLDYRSLMNNHTISELLAIYLEIAKIQEMIIPYLGNNSSFPAIGDSFFSRIISRMDRLHERITRIELPSPRWKGMDIQKEMSALRYAYYTVKTDIYYIQMSTGRSSTALEGCLQSARQQLTGIVSMYLSQESDKDIQRTVSFLHWTILFYPLTAFFVIFCNSVANSQLEDFRLLKLISDCLKSESAISSPLAKMHILFQTFVCISQEIFDQVASDPGQFHGDTSLSSGYHVYMSQEPGDFHGESSIGAMSAVRENSMSSMQRSMPDADQDSHTGTKEASSEVKRFHSWDEATASSAEIHRTEPANFPGEN